MLTAVDNLLAIVGGVLGTMGLALDANPATWGAQMNGLGITDTATAMFNTLAGGFVAAAGDMLVEIGTILTSL